MGFLLEGKEKGSSTDIVGWTHGWGAALAHADHHGMSTHE